VALSLKQPALIGLDTAELRQRLDTLASSVGCDKQGAARLVAASSMLVMLRPEYIQVRRRLVVRQAMVALLEGQQGVHPPPFSLSDAFCGSLGLFVSLH
jgi:hypothetical protein